MEETMKKKAVFKKWIALLMTMALLLGEGSQVMAMSVSDNAFPKEQSETMMIVEEAEEVVSGNDSISSESEDDFSEDEEILIETEEVETEETVSDNELKEEETEESLPEKEIGEEAVSDNEMSEASESISDNELKEEETEESLSDNTVEETVSENNMDENTEGLFPGLEKGYVLSSDEMRKKRILRGHVNDVESMEEGKDYVAGEIIVDADSEEIALQYAQAFGGTLKDYMPGAALITLGVDKEGRQVTVAQAMSASASEDIKLPAAWPNYYYYATNDVSIYSDPFLKENEYGYQWHHSVIGSRQAWEAGYTGAGVKVAVLDSGINSSHEDIVATPLDAQNGLGTEDGNSHGTHVAGIIGARGDNSYGGSGVAPDVELYSIKVLADNGGGTDFQIMQGVRKAIDERVNIINMSLGGYGYNPEHEALIVEAYNSGIAVFCAAGNDGAQALNNPAGYSGAIPVSALDKNSHKASFSNYGKQVRYSAPGVDIYSTGIGFSSSYRFMSGTSQATPVVAGTAAVLWNSVGGQGKAKVDNLLKLMDASCEKVSGTGLGKGCVSLIKALKLDSVTGAPNAPVFDLAKGTYDSETVDVEIISGAGTTVYYTTDGKNITYKNGKISDGAILYTKGSKVTLGGKASVTLKAIAINNYNQLASKVTSVTYTLKPLASSISIVAADKSDIVAQGKSIQLKAELYPAYTANKKVEWTVLHGATDITVNKSSGKVTAKRDAAPMQYWVRATAIGADGNYSGVYCDYPVQVIETTNNPITSIKIVSKNVTIRSNESGNVIVAVAKKDKTSGRAEEIHWSSSDDSIVQYISAYEDQLILQGVKAGKAKINGIATDGSGKKVSFNVTVTQPSTSVVISGYDTVAAGKSITLNAVVGPENVTNKKVKWSMETPLYGVTVSAAGKVTAKAGVSGYCVVKAEAADGSGMYATHPITVTYGKMNKLTLDATSINIFRVANQFGSPTNAYMNVTATGDNIDAWIVQSSNEDLVRAEKVGTQVYVEATGKATGTATITVMSTDGSNLKKTCKVTVNNPATNMSLAPEKGRSSYIAYGKTLKLIPTFETAYGKVAIKAKDIEWSSSSEAIQVDKNGNAKTKWAGWYSAEITARTTDGSNLTVTYYVQTCGVTQSVEMGEFFEIYGDIYFLPTHNSMTFRTGYYYTFQIYTPSTYWYSSQEFDIKVDKPGMTVGHGYDDEGYRIIELYANKPGTYKVTISCNDGSTAKKTYTVKVIG
mgnify:CR=1 FL=1